MSNRFDLEKALAAWRRTRTYNRAFDAHDLDELERHLRDQVAALVARGADEEAAYRQALREMGEYGTVEREYRKVFWRKRRQQGTLIDELTWRLAMLKNYFVVAWRAMQRQKGYAFINIAGLALGMAVCFLILLFVQHERSYDRFHEHADDIYRVVRFGDHLATSPLLAPTLEAEFPDVVRGVRISPRWPEVLVTKDGESQYEPRFFFTDSTFFEVFSFPLLQGNPETALARPFTVVLTETMARKYFGTADALGQTLRLKGPWEAHDFEVTGVAADPPATSHFQFNFLASFATRYYDEPRPENLNHWYRIGDYTYIRLQAGTAVEDLAVQMPDFLLRHHGDWYRNPDPPGVSNSYTFQPITDIHLHSHLERELETNGEERYLYIFSLAALLILLIACINYMNLATARSMQRAREVGVRKVVGAHRWQLVGQFLSESAVQIGLAFCGALLLVWLGLPILNDLLQTEIAWAGGQLAQLAAVALGVSVCVGVLAGSYPAFLLSGFRPVQVLKGDAQPQGTGARLRQALVVVQFAASVLLALGTLTIYQQLRYMQEQKLGLDPEQVIVLDTHAEMGRSSYPAFREALVRHSHIHQVSIGPALPVRIEQMLPFMEKRSTPGEDSHPAYGFAVSEHFLETLEIPLVAGRTFQPGDAAQAMGEAVTPVLVTEETVRHFGWENPIGQTFECCFRPIPEVVGVVADFHHQSLKEALTPLVLMPTGRPGTILVRVGTEEIGATLAYLEHQWQATMPDYPFSYSFMDERFAAVYDAEQRLAQIFGIFSGLAILLACLGLFGLAAFTAQRRTKEVGIRKVLGATAGSLVALLSKDFLKLIAVAFCVAAPLAYFAMQRWLEDFAYRIDIGVGVFLWSGAAVLGIALATVSYQAIRAALANPVESLRHE